MLRMLLPLPIIVVRCCVLIMEKQITRLIGASIYMVFPKVLAEAKANLDQGSSLHPNLSIMWMIIHLISDRVVSNSSIAMPSTDQCQQFIALLQSTLAASSPSSSSSSAAQTSSSASPQQISFTGTTLFSPFIAAISSPSPFWLLDTGATHHVCCNLTLFSSSSPVNNAYVNLPNGATATVTHMGTIHLTSTITLFAVLYVPSFSFNLISVSSLTSSLSCIITFTHNSLEVQEASQGIVIGKGIRLGNLYTLDVGTDSIPGSQVSPSSPCINSVVSIDLWHKRLGPFIF